MPSSLIFASLYIDGGSRGNPGPAGAGIIIKTKNHTHSFSIPLGHQTNNYAEYQALIHSLKESKKLDLKEIIIYSDSELLVNQMKGIYKVKSPNLIPLYNEAKKLVSYFESTRFNHIPREKNKEADKLANIAMDRI